MKETNITLDTLHYIGDGKISKPVTVGQIWMVGFENRWSARDENGKEYIGGKNDFISGMGLVGRNVWDKQDCVTITKVENGRFLVWGKKVYECRAQDLSFSKIPLTNSPEQAKVSEMNTEYQPPQTIETTIQKIKQCCPNVKWTAENLTEDQKVCVEQLKGNLNLFKFKLTINHYSVPQEKELFESEFIQNSFNRKDLSNDDINSLLMLSEEYARSMQIRGMINLLDSKLKACLAGEDKAGKQMGLAEQAKLKSRELEKCNNNILKLSQSLKSSTADKKIDISVASKPITITSTPSGKEASIFQDILKSFKEGLASNQEIGLTQQWSVPTKEEAENFKNKFEESFKKIFKQYYQDNSLAETAAQPNKKILLLDSRRDLLKQPFEIGQGTQIDIMRADDPRIGQKDYDLVVGELEKKNKIIGPDLMKVSAMEILESALKSKIKVLITAGSYRLSKQVFENVEKLATKMGVEFNPGDISKGFDRWEMKIGGSKISAVAFGEKMRGYQADSIVLADDSIDENRAQEILYPMMILRSTIPLFITSLLSFKWE